MCMVNSSDIILGYLHFRQKVTKEQLMKDLNSLCNNLVDEGVFTAIDFNFYETKITSDVVQETMDDFSLSGVIEERHSVIRYEMTDYGNRVTDYLLNTFKNEQKPAWDIYSKLLTNI